MTRFELFELNWQLGYNKTIVLSIFLIEIDYGSEPSLLSVGVVEGDWCFDVLYFSWFKEKYEQWKERDL